MNFGDKLDPAERLVASAILAAGLENRMKILGRYHAKHYRKGKLLWEEVFPNLVVTVGKNYMLDGSLQTAPTIVGPYMGLVSGTPTLAAGDTMASHAGWNEVGLANAPTYSGNRKTCVWSAASAGAKALSAALNFAITSTGTVGGAFLVLSTSAVNTIDSTAGTLFSAGAFATGNRSVLSGDQINVSYSISL